MDFLNEYIVLVVMGICACVGFIIKYIVPSDSINRYIPAMVGVLGVLINVWHNGFTFTPEIVLGGLTSGLASTGAYEAIRNIVDRIKEAKK